MKIVTVVCFLMGLSSSGFAQTCSEASAMRVSLRAALQLEALNFGSQPLTRDVTPIGSSGRLWRVDLSYSGVQHTYVTKLDPGSCRVIGLELDAGSR